MVQQQVAQAPSAAPQQVQPIVEPQVQSQPVVTPPVTNQPAPTDAVPPVTPVPVTPVETVVQLAQPNEDLSLLFWILGIY